MTATFIRPSAVTAISGTFASHVARKSANPGVDYACARGTRINAIASGIVTAFAWSSEVGWWTHIDFDNGWGADYLHQDQSPAFFNIKVGQHVVTGQQIGESGGSGSVATGPHLHVSLRPSHGHALLNVGNVDLEKWLAGAPATDVITGYITAAYVTKLRAALGLASSSSVFSTVEVKTLQTKIGTPADGAFGHNSNLALQKFVGLPIAQQDGKMGAVTIAAWKAAIDAGKFGAVTPPVVTPPTPPTQAAYDALVKQLAAATTTVVDLNTKVATITADDNAQKALIAGLQKKIATAATALK